MLLVGKLCYVWFALWHQQIFFFLNDFVLKTYALLNKIQQKSIFHTFSLHLLQFYLRLMKLNQN